MLRMWLPTSLAVFLQFRCFVCIGFYCLVRLHVETSKRAFTGVRCACYHPWRYVTDGNERARTHCVRPAVDDGPYLKIHALC